MQQTSTVSTAFRGLVMLTLLVVIPLLAFCGANLPEIFWELGEGRFLPTATQNAAASNSALAADPTEDFEPLPPSELAGHGTVGEYPPGVNSEASQAAPGHSIPAGLSTADQLRLYQDRLRELGATYLLLETWGGQDYLYRFSCRMAIRGNTTCTRHFEAIRDDPLQAMAAVLAEVEKWRSANP